MGTQQDEDEDEDGGSALLMGKVSRPDHGRKANLAALTVGLTTMGAIGVTLELTLMAELTKLVSSIPKLGIGQLGSEAIVASAFVLFSLAIGIISAVLTRPRVIEYLEKSVVTDMINESQKEAQVPKHL